MRVLRSKALSPGLGRSPWAAEKDFLPLTNAAYRDRGGTVVVLEASLEKVQTCLSKALKPGRRLLSVVKMKSGEIEEFDNVRRLPVKYKKKEPEKAVTVAALAIGCPLPEFPQADIRASRVLSAFLSPEQLEDYLTTGAFVSRGVSTGHRYLITNRERQGRMAHVSFRSLYDLDEHRPLCVHDWTVPPPEEMLALHLCVSMPGWERHVRSLPEVFGS